MEKIEIPREIHQYLSQVLGVERAYLSSPIEEERKNARSWVTVSRFSDASWMVFADISGDEITSEEDELLSKMLGALKIPEKQMNVFLLPESVETVDKLKTEIPAYKKVLVLGERASALTAEVTKDLTPNQLTPFFNQKIVATHSVKELLSTPGKKGTTWNAMKSLLTS